MRPADVDAAQALADVATIAILQHRATLEAQILNEQLNEALNSRVVIEQAKGMVAERDGLNMEQAFSALRNHARNHNLRLVDVAHDVIGGTQAAGALDRPPPSHLGADGPRDPAVGGWPPPPPSRRPSGAVARCQKVGARATVGASSSTHLRRAAVGLFRLAE